MVVVQSREIDTEAGPARVHMMGSGGAHPAFLLVLTHGAGGGVHAPDLAALAQSAAARGGGVAGVEQPYRVAGRRMPGAATARQDRAWSQVVQRVRGEHPAVPLVLAGRSNGARVACRTAGHLGAAAVVALAFPLHPPGKPERSRAAELREAGVPVVVVNGDRDPFGVPEAADTAALEVRPGETHALDKDPEGAAAAAMVHLEGVLSAV